MTKLNTGKTLDDRSLLERLDALCARDRRVTAQLLWHLAEVDRRGLCRERGYSSLFNYCVQALHMSEAEAGLRIRVARAARRYPVIYRHVDRGELHLSAVSVLAPVLTPDNHQRLLRAAVHRTKAQVQEQVADLCPQPACPDTVRKLPSARRQDLPDQPGPSLFDPTQAPNAPASVSSAQAMSAQADSSAPPSERRQAGAATVAPLGQQRYRIQLTADRHLHDQLKVAQDLMRHKVPDGDLNVILGKALTLLVQTLKKQRFARTSAPRAAAKPTQPGTRHVPAQVRRAVAERDNLRCTFVSEDGRRCTETGWLEFHHHEPFARGGPTTADNVALMCRAHNALLAERHFGREHMARVSQPRVQAISHFLDVHRA